VDQLGTLASSWMDGMELNMGHLSDDIEVGMGLNGPLSVALPTQPGLPTSEQAPDVSNPVHDLHVTPQPPHDGSAGNVGAKRRTGLMSSCLQKTGLDVVLTQAEAQLNVKWQRLASQLGLLWRTNKGCRLAVVVLGGAVAALIFFFHFLADWHRILSLLGMLSILGACSVSYESGTWRPKIRDGVVWSRAASSLSLQLIFGILIVYTPVYSAFFWLGEQVNVMLGYCQAGSDFVFASPGAHGNQPTISALNIAAVNVTTVLSDGHGNILLDDHSNPITTTQVRTFPFPQAVCVFACALLQHFVRVLSSVVC
jgi:hypothetical protein